MGPSEHTAADLVNQLDETQLANVLFSYGEERASRRIAKAIVKRRTASRFESTLDLAQVIQSVMPRQKLGQIHPATRSFQALRIAVNNEYQELFDGLYAAEQALGDGGLLMVVTFHSIEDRMVKRFLQMRSGLAAKANRFAPEIEEVAPQFELITKKAVGADPDELSINPRARSAKLRAARRTSAASAEMLSEKELGMPVVGIKANA
jgi:16S rRNA (cytosine1402-N4)-methyltransferase